LQLLHHLTQLGLLMVFAKRSIHHIVTGNLVSTLVVKKPLEKVTVMLANDTAQNKTVAFTIGPTLN
jgi:hypothetical protein